MYTSFLVCGIILVHCISDTIAQTSLDVFVDTQHLNKSTTEMPANSAEVGGGAEPPVPKITSCQGQWGFPRGCDVSKGACEYHAWWEFYPREDEVKFTITTTNTDLWTGIGFSDDRAMPQTDAVIGWVDRNGSAFLMDTWINGYTIHWPIQDTSQDIYNKTGHIDNGHTVLSFVRKRNTEDQRDMAFTDDRCLYMMFPVKGGLFNYVNKKIRKHNDVPKISAQRICIRSREAGEDTPATTDPPRVGYKVFVKLGQSFKAPEPRSADFDLLANTVSDGFNRALEKIPGFHRMAVKEFQQEEDGVITRLSLQLDEAPLDQGQPLEDNHDSVVQLLNETLISGDFGALTLDPHYLKVVHLYGENPAVQRLAPME